MELTQAAAEPPQSGFAYDKNNMWMFSLELVMLSSPLLCGMGRSVSHR